MVKSLYCISLDQSLVSNTHSHVTQLTTTFNCSSKECDAFGLWASRAWTHTRTHTYTELKNKKKTLKNYASILRVIFFFKHKWSSTREIITDTGMLTHSYTLVRIKTIPVNI